MSRPNTVTTPMAAMAIRATMIRYSLMPWPDWDLILRRKRRIEDSLLRGWGSRSNPHFVQEPYDEGRRSPIGRGSEHPPARRGESRALAPRRKSALPFREEGGPSMLRKLALVALTCVATPVFAAGDSRVKIAVLDLQARGVDAGLVQSAGTLI